jgi:cobalamin biosynthesis protein CobD/CbiB
MFLAQDAPWWMALTPAVGFLLDALLGGLWRRRAVAGAVWRLAARMAVVMRAGGGGARWMGAIHVAWIAAITGGLTFGIDVAAFAAGRDFAKFAVHATVFMLLFAVRRLATAGLYVAAAVEAGNLAVARQWAEALGARIPGEDAAAVVGATTQRIGTGLISAALLPLAWGALLGPVAAVVAVTIHEVARWGRRVAGRAEPFHDVANRLDRGLGEPAAWLGVVALRAAFPLMGGSGSLAWRRFRDLRGLAPEDRLACALAGGLGLGGAAGGGAELPPPRAEDLSRVLVALWLCALSAAMVATVVLALLLQV